MAVFHFKARSRSGDLTEGTVTAASRPGAIRVVEDRGLFPVSVAEVAEKSTNPTTPLSPSSFSSSSKSKADNDTAAPPPAHDASGTEVPLKQSTSGAEASAATGASLSLDQSTSPINGSAGQGLAAVRERAEKARSESSARAARSATEPQRRDIKNVDAVDADLEPLRSADLLLFSEQLSHLLNAGLNLDQALGVLARRMRKKRLRLTVERLHRSLLDGETFSTALRRHPRSFSPIYVNLAAAGEVSGALAKILQRLVAYLRQMRDLVTSIQMALIYPAVLLLGGLGLILLFIFYLVPKLTGFLEGVGGATLPLPTRILIGTYDFAAAWWWAMLLVLAVISTIVAAWRNTPDGRLTWDEWALRVPVIGPLSQARFCAQFASTLSTLLSQGVTLLRALELLEEMTSNQFLNQGIRRTREAVTEGASLSRAAEENKLLPELFIDMLSVGEQAGQMAATLDNIGDYYETELDKSVKTLSAVVPVVVIAVVGVIIGAVVFSILVAVFSVTQSLQGSVG